MVVYSIGKNAKFDNGDADDFVSLIMEASKAYKMKFVEPGFVTCDSNLKSYKAEI
jgi:hypothetical protein